MFSGFLVYMRVGAGEYSPEAGAPRDGKAAPAGVAQGSRSGECQPELKDIRHTDRPVQGGEAGIKK